MIRWYENVRPIPSTTWDRHPAQPACHDDTPLPNTVTQLKTLLIIVAVLLVPIIPFVFLGSYLEPTIEDWFDQSRLKANPVVTSAAVVVILASDILLPVPSSFVGTVAGQTLGTVVGSLATWMGLNLSCLIGYWLAAVIGTPLIKRLADDNAIRDVESMTAMWGVWALIGLRPIPVLAEASVLLAGLGRMPQRKFWPAVIGANLGLSIAYAALGSYSAEHGWLGLALAVSIAIPLALFCGWLFARKRHRAAPPGD